MCCNEKRKSYCLIPWPVSCHQICELTFPLLTKHSFWSYVNLITKVPISKLTFHHLERVTKPDFIWCCHPCRYVIGRNLAIELDGKGLPWYITYFSCINCVIEIFCTGEWAIQVLPSVLLISCPNVHQFTHFLARHLDFAEQEISQPKISAWLIRIIIILGPFCGRRRWGTFRQVITINITRPS